MTPVAFLNHDFIDGMAHRTDLGPVAVALQDAQRRLQPASLHVHPDISAQQTGAGDFIQWANRMRNAHDDGHRALSELLLHLLSGPFVTDLPISDVEIYCEDPPLPEVPAWRSAAVRHLAQHTFFAPGTMPSVLSFDPRSHLNESQYRFTQGSATAQIDNFRSVSEFKQCFDALALEGLSGALAILDQAGRQCNRLIILDKARESARHWTLDCTEETLFRALIMLEAYAEALDEGLSREVAAERYHERSGIEMSQETNNVKTSPTRRRYRMIDVPGHGTQYFDMHAKPGKSKLHATRVHVWTTILERRHVVFVGHCGEHFP